MTINPPSRWILTACWAIGCSAGGGDSTQAELGTTPGSSSVTSASGDEGATSMASTATTGSANGTTISDSSSTAGDDTTGSSGDETSGQTTASGTGSVTVVTGDGASGDGSGQSSAATATASAPSDATFTFEPESATPTMNADGEDCGPNLTGVLRDFSYEHPDFGDAVAEDYGIVEDTLGPGRKPIYASATTTPTTTGAANFDQWYRDTEGINESMEFTLNFVPSDNGVYTYDNQLFFPLDDALIGFGNEYLDHNFHFTFELHTEFIYRGGEVFTFSGDDDLWVFINNKLAIDLGGVHIALTDQIDLDAAADEFGLVVDNIYPLDFFHAERHASDSHFRVDTTLEFTDCGTIILK